MNMNYNPMYYCVIILILTESLSTNSRVDVAADSQLERHSPNPFPRPVPSLNPSGGHLWTDEVVGSLRSPHSTISGDYSPIRTNKGNLSVGQIVLLLCHRCRRSPFFLVETGLRPVQIFSDRKKMIPY